jgi:hypothetical protein
MELNVHLVNNEIYILLFSCEISFHFFQEQCQRSFIKSFIFAHSRELIMFANVRRRVSVHYVIVELLLL